MNGKTASRCVVRFATGALLALALSSLGGCSKEEKPAEASTATTSAAANAAANAAPVAAPVAVSAGKSVWQPGTDGCLRLGWSGGAAGTGYKYVDTNIVTETKDLVMFQYEQKNGSMKGEKASPEELKGTWSQKSATGTFYLKFDPSTNAATGWWRTDGKDNRNLMTLDKKCNN